MNDKEWLAQNVSDDPALVEYLAETLGTFMAVNRRNRQKWSKLRVATAITSHPEIDGTLNDTTLGRFLDPLYPQDPSVATIRKVAHFLLFEGAITRRDVELHATSPDLRLASALNALQGNPETTQQTAFLESLQGHYLGQNSANGYLLFTRLILTYRAEANALLADEVQRLYRVPNDSRIENWRNAFQRGTAQDPGRLIANTGGQEVESFVSSGVVVADPDLGLILLRAAGRGLSGALNLSTIVFNDADVIEGFSALRNSGWSVQAPGEILPPIVVSLKTPPRDIVKSLAREGSFRKQNSDKQRKIDKPDQDTINIDDSLGFVDISIDYENEIMDQIIDEQELRQKPPDEQLLLALEWGSLDLFGTALDAGADANLVPEGAEGPIVFLLARDGKQEWVDVLLATGRCDLTRLDRNGMTAGYRAGVLARKFSTQSDTLAEAQRFGTIAVMLRDERNRQLSAGEEDMPTP